MQKVQSQLSGRSDLGALVHQNGASVDKRDPQLAGMLLPRLPVYLDRSFLLKSNLENNLVFTKMPKFSI